MKIIKELNKKQTRTLTLRISEETMKKIDKISDENEISRQKLIEAILDQVASDKSFILKVK